MSWPGAALVAGTVAAGLGAGLFAAFSYAVMPGLSRTSDAVFVESMQRINAAILNGWLALSLGGALVLPALAALGHLGGDDRSVLPWIVAGLALHLATLLVTGAVNVPLNNRLLAAGDPARIADVAEVRAAFEATWVRWNAVRAVLATAALACLGWALVLHGRLSG